MDRRTITALFWAAIAIESIFCYRWFLKPYGPVFISLLQGTYEYNLFSDFFGVLNGLIRVIIQFFAFSILFIVTTKLYKHIYASLPNDTSDSADNK